MITSRRDSLNLKRLGIPPKPRRWHRAPPLRVRPAPARATRPAAAHVLELAVLEGTHGRRGAGGAEGDVGTGGVVACVEVEVGVWAVGPGDGGVGAGVGVGMAAAHFKGLVWVVVCWEVCRMRGACSLSELDIGSCYLEEGFLSVESLFFV